VVVSFLGGGSWSAPRKPSTLPQVTENFIIQCCNIFYTSIEHIEVLIEKAVKKMLPNN
jgi:hypothetical protein